MYNCFYKKRKDVMVKNMKKLLAVMLAVLMLLSAVACSGDTNADDLTAVKPKGESLVTTFVAETGTYTYDYIDNAHIYITKYEGKDAKHELVIPATMNDKNVVAIEDGAFANLSNITAVTVPASVEKIGEYAFASCKELKTVKLPAGLTELEKGAFFGCSALTTVTFTETDNAKLTAIGEGVFSECSALTSINLPASVKEIGKGAFFKCSALTAIALPAGLEKIAQQAFHQCIALTSVAFPATLTSCEAAAFAECTALTQVTFADTANWNVDLSTNAACLEALLDDFNTALVKTVPQQ